MNRPLLIIAALVVPYVIYAWRLGQRAARQRLIDSFIAWVKTADSARMLREDLARTQMQFGDSLIPALPNIAAVTVKIANAFRRYYDLGDSA